MTFEVNLTNPLYTVVGNSSNLEGLNVTFENGNITISPALNYQPDNFTLIFFDNLTREVIKTIHTGGGSSRTKYIKENVTVYKPVYINDTKITEVEGGTCDVEDIPTEEAYPWFKLIIWLLTALAVIIFIIIDVIKYKKGNT